VTATNGFKDIKVTLLDSGEKQPFRMFWNWYRETWYSLRDQEFDHTNPKHLSAAIDVVAARALPIPQEALQFQIRVEGLSRVGLAQFTRGRIGWAYVVILPSLAGHDRYHHRAGFILAKAGLAAHIIDKEHGLAGSLFIPVVNE